MKKPVEPYRNFDLNESGELLLDLTHLNASKVLEAPTTLSYRIDDLTNSRQVLDWTSVATPGSTNTITVTKAQNAFNSRAVDRELRQITVNAVDSAGNESNDIFIYTLIRIFDNADKVI